MVVEYATKLINRAVRLAAFTAAICVSLAFLSERTIADTSPVYLRDLPCTPALAPANKVAGQLYGAEYSHAIVSTAGDTWRISFQLDGKYGEFTAEAGVADGLSGLGAVFSVTGDGKTLYPVTTKHSGDEPCLIDADVSGIQQLVLTAGPVPGASLPKTVWADPQLLTAPPAANAGAPATAPESGDANPPPQGAPDSGPEAPDSGSATPAQPATESSTEAVVPFGGTFDDFPDASDGVTKAVNSHLGAIANTMVLPLGRVKQTMTGATGYLSPDDVKQAAQLLGARFIVMGAVDRYNVHTEIKTGFGIIRYQALIATVEFDAELWNGQTDRRLKSVTARATKEEPLLPGGSDARELLDKARDDAAKQFVDAVAPYITAAGDPLN